MNVTKVYFVDHEYDSELNRETINLLSSKPEYILLIPLRELDEAFNQILKLGMELIFVIVRGRMYQDYYEKLKKYKYQLKCSPISIIYTSAKFRSILEKKEIDMEGNLNQETLDSIGDNYYNKGGIAILPIQLLNIIENILHIELESKSKEEIFQFVDINTNYENLIIPCLYSKVRSRNSLISPQEKSNFNNKIKQSSQYLTLGSIENATLYWISYFTSDESFNKIINEKYLEKNTSYYITFEKALNRGLEKGLLKRKFDVPLYYASIIQKNDFQKLESNINKQNKQLIYSRQFLSFSQDKNVAYEFLKNGDDKYIPVLFEVNISSYSEPYSINFDIGEFSSFPKNKEVIFAPYSCFVIEDKIEELKKEKIKYKKIKLNYLGEYTLHINKLINILDEKKIESSLKDKSSQYIKDITSIFRKEFPKLELFDLIKWIGIEAKLLADKNKQKENYKYPINTIEIKMEKKGKFLGDDYFLNSHWMLDIYFNDLIEPDTTNEITKDNLPEKIKINIKYPIFDCEKMFYKCDNIEEIIFKSFDTSRVTSMKYMFSDCNSLSKVNVGDLDTTNVTNMSCMFYRCNSLKSLDLSNFKTNNVTDMSAMFYLCTSLKNLNFDLSKMNLDKLEDISYMFRGSSHSLENYSLYIDNFKKDIQKEGYI